MKPFNLELAKHGYPVCTRTGGEYIITSFDGVNTNYPLTGHYKNDSVMYYHTLSGVFSQSPSQLDLFMKDETPVNNTLCCDRCGRTIGLKSFININGWIICGICEWEENNKNKKQ